MIEFDAKKKDNHGFGERYDPPTSKYETITMILTPKLDQPNEFLKYAREEYSKTKKNKQVHQGTINMNEFEQSIKEE